MSIHPMIIFNILQEICHIQAQVKLPGCDPTELFDFLPGGKQGGVDNPDLFNAVIEFLLTKTLPLRGRPVALAQSSRTLVKRPTMLFGVTTSG